MMLTFNGRSYKLISTTKFFYNDGSLNQETNEEQKSLSLHSLTDTILCSHSESFGSGWFITVISFSIYF